MSVTSQPKSSPPHAELGSFPRFWRWHGAFTRLWFVPTAIPANSSWSQTQWLKHSVVQHISSCLVFGGNQATFPLLFTWFPPKSVKWPALLQSTNLGSVSSIYTFICSVWGKSFKSLLQKPNAEPGHGWKKDPNSQIFPFFVLLSANAAQGEHCIEKAHASLPCPIAQRSCYCPEEFNLHYNNSLQNHPIFAVLIHSSHSSDLQEQLPKGWEATHCLGPREAAIPAIKTNPSNHQETDQSPVPLSSSYTPINQPVSQIIFEQGWGTPQSLFISQQGFPCPPVPLSRDLLSDPPEQDRVSEVWRWLTSHISVRASGFYFYCSKILSLPRSKPISHAHFWEQLESRRDQELYVVSLFDLIIIHQWWNSFLCRIPICHAALRWNIGHLISPLKK